MDFLICLQFCFFTSQPARFAEGKLRAPERTWTPSRNRARRGPAYPALLTHRFCNRLCHALPWRASTALSCFPPYSPSFFFLSLFMLSSSVSFSLILVFLFFLPCFLFHFPSFQTLVFFPAILGPQASNQLISLSSVAFRTGP